MAKIEAHCISPSHPLIREVEKKYHLSRKDAKTIINNARKNDPALQTDDITLEYIESAEVFQNELAAFVGKAVKKRNWLFGRRRNTKTFNEQIKEQIQQEVGEDYSETEIKDLLQLKQEMEKDLRMSKLSAEKIASVLRSFRDPRRFEFLGDFITKYISNIITLIQTDPEVREALGISQIGNRKDYFLNQSAANAIRDSIKNLLLEKAEACSDPNLAQELRSAADQLPTIMYMFGGRIFRTEGISVDENGVFTVPTSNNSSAEQNDNNEDNDDDNPDDSEKPVDPFSASDQNKSVSSKIVPDIKLLLSSITEVDSEGNEIQDKYGYGLPIYISAPSAVNKILHTCMGCQSFSEMKVALEGQRKRSPWIGTLLNILDTKTTQDTTGETEMSQSRKEQLQTQFFKSFRKQLTNMRQTYMSMDADGLPAMVTVSANVSKTKNDLMYNIRHVFYDIQANGGELDVAVFNEIHQMLKSKYGKETGVNGFMAQAYSKALDIAKDSAANDIFQSFAEADKAINKAVSLLTQVLNEVGFNITEDTIQNYLDDTQDNITASYFGNVNSWVDPDFSRRYAKIQKLLGEADRLLNSLEELSRTNPAGNPFNYRQSGKTGWAVKSRYEKIAEMLSTASPGSYESRAYINGKDYYCWNNPSTIGTIIENLSSEDRKKVKEYIQEKYGQDTEWFMKQDGSEFYSDWLNAILNGEKIEYSEKPSSFGKDYKDLSPAEMTLSILADYFSQEDGPKDNKAWYRMIISSDKPHHSSIRFIKHSDRSMVNGEWTEKNYHNVIARKAVDFFMQELRRGINVVNASRSTTTIIKDYDISLPEHINTKIKNHQEVTVDDVLKDGRYIFKTKGASFFFSPFPNTEIENKTALGKYIVDRMFNSWKYQGQELLTEKAISDYKDAFHTYMQDMKKNYLADLDRNGLLAEVSVKDRQNNTSAYHLHFFAKSLQNWHKNKNIYSDNKQAAQDFAEREGIELTPENRPYFAELMQLHDDVEEFLYNNWLAKANMLQIIDVDPAFYGSTTNLQKRAAQNISAGYAIDPEAKLHGDTVTDGKYRSMTLATPKSSSKYINNIKVLFDKQLKAINDPLLKKQFAKDAKAVIKALKDFDPTDGQAFTSLSGLRKRRVGTGDWSRSDDKATDMKGYTGDESNPQYVYTDEAVYQRMKRGYREKIDRDAMTGDLMHTFAQIQKPFVYGFVNMERDGRTITVPVQHKNSEYALTYLTAFTAFQSDKELSPIEAIARFMEETAERNPKAGIDTINFDSAVKIGLTDDVTDTDVNSGDELLENLRDAYNDKRAFPNAVTEYDVRDYKIVQEKPEHFKNSTQPMGSQMKILAVNNIPDDAVCPLPNGKSISGKELKQRYFKALSEKTQKELDEFREEFGLNMPRSKRLYKLSNMLKAAMSTDQKFSVDMRRALSIHEKNGEDMFVLPLDESGQQASIEAMLLSKIRKVFFKQKTFGGIVPQATSWGSTEDLHIRFFSSNPEDENGVCQTLDEYLNSHNGATEEDYRNYLKKYQMGFAYFESEVPMPEHIKAMLMKNGKVQDKYLNPDSSWNMEEIKNTVPSEMLDIISYRIPTEAKYSIMAGKVVRFCPEGTSVVKYPLELTVFTGSDFDIDTDTIELRPPRTHKNHDVDSELFDLQMAALRSGASAREVLHNGDFTDLKEQSYYLMLLSSGKYSKTYLDSLSPNQLKALCDEEENLDIMNPVTDVLLHEQNMTAKDLIGIAAVGNASHAFMSLFSEDSNPDNTVRMHFGKGNPNVDIPTQQFTVVDEDGEELILSGDIILDPVYDMDGNLISLEIGKYIGASADAAKDAALFRLNITRDTLPVLITMHRLGISPKTARAFLSQPVIRELTAQMHKANIHASAVDINSTIQSLLNNYKEDYPNEDIDSIWGNVSQDRGLTLVYSELLENIENPKKQEIYSKLSTLHIFEVLYNKAQSLRNLDSFSRYNSATAMRGASFLDRLMARRRLENLAANLEKENPAIKLPENIDKDQSIETLYKMFPYIANTVLGEEALTQDIILDNMKTYGNTFFLALNKVLGESDGSNSNADAAVAKKLYAAWKSYLLFVGPNKIADFSNKKNMLHYTRDFANVFTKWKEKYADLLEGNSFIASINFQQASTEPGTVPFELLSTDINGIQEKDKEEYMRDWESLLDRPETRQMAIDLGIYFLARSAAFSRDTPMHLMPLRAKEAIPNYLKAFEEADQTELEEDGMLNFLTMFQLNNSDNKKIVPHFYENRQAGEKFTYDNGVLTFNNIQSLSSFVIWRQETKDEAFFRLPVIKVNGQLYLVDTFADITAENIEGTDRFVFSVPAQPVESLGIPNQMSEYTDMDISRSIFREPASVSDNQEQPSPMNDDVTIEPPIVIREETSNTRQNTKRQMSDDDITATLSSTFLEDLSEEAYNDFSNAVVRNTVTAKTELSQMENFLKNTVQWLLGGRSKENLLTMMQNIGLSRKTSEEITNLVERKLNELDVC